jgi:hypothetical protein
MQAGFMVRIPTINLARSFIVVLIGMAVIFESTRYGLGTIRSIGPGAFPMISGILMVVLGIILLFERDEGKSGDEDGLRLRAILPICASIAAFALLINAFGLIPAVAATVLLAALAEPANRPVPIIMLTVGTSIATAVIFSYGLRLPFPLIIWW